MGNVERDQDISRSGRVRKLLLGIGVFSIVFAALFAFATWEYGRARQWWGETNQLREYKDSPLTTDPLLGYVKVREEQSRPVGLTGKRSMDWYKAFYDTGEDSDEVAVSRLVEFSEREGFSVRPGTSTPPNSIHLTREEPSGGTLSLRISVEDLDEAQTGGISIVSIYIHDF